MEESTDADDDDPRFKLSEAAKARLRKKNTFKEDLEITRNCLAQMGFKYSKGENIKPSVESDEAPPEESVINIDPLKLESEI